nr:hypothetical protein B0A51_11709 [Rachicladosporium sp. CCFEE 5018]
MQQPPPGSYAPPPQGAVSTMRRYDGKDGMPLYDARQGGHYGASALIAAAHHAPQPESFQGHWQNVAQGLGSGQYRDILNTYWQHVVNQLEYETHDYKIHQLPLARIKKVMKADPEVKMISAEAPIIFAKACETFITELTMRAWIHAEENKRRTLQRSDIAAALAKSDMFDFLIDIVPREDATPQHKRRPEYVVPEPAQPEQQQPQQQQQPMVPHQEYGMQPPPPPEQQQQPPQQAYYQQQMYDPNMGQQMYQQMYPPQPPSDHLLLEDARPAIHEERMQKLEAKVRNDWTEPDVGGMESSSEWRRDVQEDHFDDATI